MTTEDAVPPRRRPPPRPGPPPPNLAFLVMAVGRRVRIQVDATLAESGMTYRHLSVLGHLARDPDLSYAELARRGGVTTQSMQATLGQLRQLGAVEQLNPARRGLKAKLRVTSTGAALLHTGTEAIERIEHQLLEMVGREDQDSLRAGLFSLFMRFADQHSSSGS